MGLKNIETIHLNSLIFSFFLLSIQTSCGLLLRKGLGDCELDTLELLVDLGNDVGHGEAEPLVKGDCSITVGIHGGEHGLPLVWGQGWQAHSKPLRRINQIVDHQIKLSLRNFSISISVCCLE